MTVAEMKSTPEPELRVDVQDRVALLTFNRPKKLNALSGEITAGLHEELPRLAADPDVGAIVLTGEGRAFCAGGDVSGSGADPAFPPSFFRIYETVNMIQCFG